MPSKKPSRGLGPRDLEILKDVVRTFILVGEPVSSRTVAKHRRHGLSAASIRNSMADLEEMGYLRQPHTSAGRQPTASGYHLYIESLTGPRRVSASDRRYIDEKLPSNAGAEQLTSSASQVLSELTHQVGVVLTPAISSTVLKAVQFVQLSGSRVLCVIVSQSGFVDNKVVELEDAIPREELIRISNYLTDSFAGMTLREIRNQLVSLMADERARMDKLLARAVSLARDVLHETASAELKVEGAAGLLNRPEVANIETVRRMLDTFADKARLVSLLTQAMEGLGVRVLIGEESDLTSELDFSLVTTPYRTGSGAVGSLGIFGPSRMEYQRVIPLVDYLGESLSQALDSSFAEDGSD